MWASPHPAGSQPGRRGGCLRGAGGAEGPGQINEKGIHVLTTWQLPSCRQVTNSPPRTWGAWTPTSFGNPRRAGRRWPSSCLCPRRWRGRCSWRRPRRRWEGRPGAGTPPPPVGSRPQQSCGLGGQSRGLRERPEGERAACGPSPWADPGPPRAGPSEPSSTSVSLSKDRTPGLRTRRGPVCSRVQ